MPTTPPGTRRRIGARSRARGAEGEVKALLFEAGSPQRRLFDAAVVEATEAIIADKTMIADSDRWFRNSGAEIDAHRDGARLELDVSGPPETLEQILPAGGGG